MQKIIGCLAFSLSLQLFCNAQEEAIPDSIKTLEEVMITAFEQNRQVISSGSSIKVLIPSTADRLNKISLVNGFNTVAGVRMEERSPASYRLNIRGSSLRSPFGVRNVKVYWNGIPVTDPGGNTYFNQFAFNNFSSIEVFKGPASSMYGAGTGGLLLMKSLAYDWLPSINLEYVGGSFGLQNILGSFGFGSKDNRNLLTYAHTESDGYRNHTRMRRDNASFVSQLKISDREQVTSSILYTNLFYETPGGLNLAEFKNNPRQARPAAGGLPSADQAKAAIYQKNFLAGINHQYQISPHFRNNTVLYGAFALIQNPTFRNYERRNEPHFGGRSTFGFHKKMNVVNMELVAGGEWQQGYFNTQVSKNRQGNPDTLQTNDDIRYSTYSIFTQGDINIKEDWFITAGISINKSDVQFTRLNKYPVINQNRSYQNEWSPRIAIVKKIGIYSSLFSSISKGFSPPTISELLPSTSVISTFLEPEQGTQYELGGRAGLLHNQLQVELTTFYFKLNNALVVRKDSSNADYYVNAGNTKQRGMELSIDYIRHFPNSSTFNNVMIRTAQTFNDFTYGDFLKNSTNYSGKWLPSVPRYTTSVLTDMQLRIGVYLNATYYYASKIFLSDDNVAVAKGYNLLGSRLGWRFSISSKIKLNVYAGIDNLLDETYSLGNDINAAAGRYYNAAPARNYYVGIAFNFNY